MNMLIAWLLANTPQKRDDHGYGLIEILIGLVVLIIVVWLLIWVIGAATDHHR